MYKLQKKDGYIPRIVEGELREALASFGAVEVCGTKWCGKTWTSLAFAEKLVQVDDESVARIAATDPSAILLRIPFPSSWTSGKTSRKSGMRSGATSTPVPAASAVSS